MLNKAYEFLPSLSLLQIEDMSYLLSLFYDCRYNKKLQKVVLIFF